MRKKSLVIVILILIVDQITKFLIVKNFNIGESYPVIKNFFYLTYITNTGMAFGRLQSYGSILLWFSIIVALAIIGLLIKEKNMPRTYSLGLSFILGGAFGNIADRLIRGSIVDFFDFRIWPIFNVADSFITVGIVLMLINSILTKNKSL